MKTRTLYICGVNWQHELGETSIEFFNSIEELKENSQCWEECGIVEVKMEAKWIVKQSLI